MWGGRQQTKLGSRNSSGHIYDPGASVLLPATAMSGHAEAIHKRLRLDVPVRFLPLGPGSHRSAAYTQND